jgi:hypothetical protein
MEISHQKTKIMAFKEIKPIRSETAIDNIVTYWIFLGNMAYAPRSVSIVT